MLLFEKERKGLIIFRGGGGREGGLLIFVWNRFAGGGGERGGSSSLSGTVLKIQEPPRSGVKKTGTPSKQWKFQKKISKEPPNNQQHIPAWASIKSKSFHEYVSIKISKMNNLVTLTKNQFNDNKSGTSSAWYPATVLIFVVVLTTTKN